MWSVAVGIEILSGFDVVENGGCGLKKGPLSSTKEVNLSTGHETSNQISIRDLEYRFEYNNRSILEVKLQMLYTDNEISMQKRYKYKVSAFY